MLENLNSTIIERELKPQKDLAAQHLHSHQSPASARAALTSNALLQQLIDP